MASERKTYTVSNIKQLIDLNGDLTNFDISFKVQSQNGEPFDILVVDQTTLDNNPDLEYKNVQNGTISGNVKNDKGVYQNYFLVLKADRQCMCDVEINRTEIPRAPQPIQTPAPSKTEGTNWMRVGLVIGVIVAVGFLLYWLSKKRTEDDVPLQINDNSAGFNFYQPSYSPSLQSSPSPEASPSVSGSHHSSHGETNPILEKLKNLNL